MKTGLSRTLQKLLIIASSRLLVLFSFVNCLVSNYHCLVCFLQLLGRTLLILTKNKHLNNIFIMIRETKIMFVFLWMCQNLLMLHRKQIMDYVTWITVTPSQLLRCCYSDWTKFRFLKEKIINWSDSLLITFLKLKNGKIFLSSS